MNFFPSAPFLQGAPMYHGYTFVDPKKYAYQGQVPLFSMALYDTSASSPMAPPVGAPHLHDSRPLHPFPPSSDEFKDLSLKEILDLSEDLLSVDDDEDDPLMTTPILEPPLLESPPAFASAISRDIVHPISPSSSYNDNPKKRRRGSNASTASSTTTPRFREYQAGQWSQMFEELVAYREANGDCLVPYSFDENRALARWVKRQRYQYKLMMEGQPSTMTMDRAQALSNIGFCWDSQTSNWMDRLNELKQFKARYGTCHVPSQYAESPQLSTWVRLRSCFHRFNPFHSTFTNHPFPRQVKCQRRQFKLYMEGKPHNITQERIDELNRLGFTWEIRAPKKPRMA